MQLPTEPGSIIGWSNDHEGRIHYAAAILDSDDDTGEPEWWVLGFSESRSPAKLLAQLERTKTKWHHVGWSSRLNPER